MATIKTAAEIRAMRAAGAVVGDVLRLMREMAEPGVRLRNLAREAERAIRAAGATPTFKGYQGFPAPICLSLNDEALHGLPSWRKLRAGDLLSVDVGATLNGWVGDSAISVVVGGGDGVARALVDAAEQGLAAAIAAARVGGHVGDLGAAVEAVVRPRGFDILASYCGHGIGRALHEDPQVPNVGPAGAGPQIAAGWCLAIEPIITSGSAAVLTRPDGWTVATRDGGLAAHAELAIAITEGGVEILSLTSAGELP
jgi:methionyl aminopeptidase